MSHSRVFVRILAAAAVCAALLLVGASQAFAGPAEPVMHFTDLRSALATSTDHHLSGYMKTVVEGAQITTIPVTVLAVPPTGTANNSLIMIEATGPLIQKYGGLVSGMSGSPVYVNDGTGTDKLVGAVSYGDEFTLGGTGLATPIDAMIDLENGFASAAPLSSTVLTQGGAFNRIIVAPNPQDYAGAAAAGAFVAKPLSAVYIGGLKPSSTGYQALAKHLASKGFTVVSPGSGAGLSAGGDPGTADFETTLTAGASVAALAARGDLWAGDIGTVTYADGSNVLAFGHSAYWSGNTALYMANAWIEGVWPSTYSPSKFGDAGAIRGTMTQDRSAGVLGKLGLRVDETTITARAVNTDTGAESTSTVYIPRALLANGIADSSLVSNAIYVAGSTLFDQRSQSGSAHATTTVTLLDGATTRTVTLANYSSSSYDIAYAVSQASATAISTLQSVLPYGIEKPQILSVDLSGEYSPHRTDATIVGVDAPSGIHVGDNRIRVSVLQYGVAATQTADTTLTIPAGTTLGGTITAQAASDVSDNSMSAGDMWGVSFKRKTISGLVDQLGTTVPDTALVVTYAPGTGSSSSDYYDDGSDSLDDPATAMSTVTKQFVSPWPVSGQARSFATLITALGFPNPLPYGGYFDGVAGFIYGPSTAQTVTVYSRTAGSSAESFVATTTATPYEGLLTFSVPLGRRYKTNNYFRVHIDGADTSTAADQELLLSVRAQINLKTSATRIRRGKSINLTASIFPNSAAGGTVVWERKSGKKWVKIAGKSLVASGSYAKASYNWKPGRGTQTIRARYLGGTYNSASTSGNTTIVVR